MVDALRLAFDPLIAWPWLIGLGVAALLAFAIYAFASGKAWFSRLAALLVLFAALSNPSIVEEEREPLPSVAALVLDRSDSMEFGDRAGIAQSVFDAYRSQLEADPAIDLRVIEPESGLDGTQLISALEGIMADVPRDRVAGAIFVTDGQVHDLPTDTDRLRALGPIHSVITGDPDAGDRRITLVETPEFDIVGDAANFVIRVDDPDSGRIAVSYSINGGREERVFVQAGVDTPVPIDIERRGDNIIVFEVPPGRRELTLANNRTAATLSGVRDGLRVLLVTGRPNASGRVWRDLLKSDPSVDLVHFTILRPPHKNQDPTPAEELALIPFPTEELFEEKLDGFDLIIFDQYERHSIITLSYLSDVARYVENGGALFIVAGNDFAGPTSLANTPLASILPALPTGNIVHGITQPTLSETGKRHTITETLEGQEWGAWLRYIEARAETGDVLMTTEDGRPLLAVDRVGEGRVAQLLSDQIWLWARGYDGGGPFADLTRRSVHWLMKEPELDERQLQITTQGDVLKAELRTLASRAAPLQIETPDGALLEPDWRLDKPGSYSADIPIDQLGLFRARSGGLDAVALNGPANPKEFAALEATTDVLRPLALRTGAGVYAVTSANEAPDIRLVSRSGKADGDNWLGLRERGAYVVANASSVPLLPGLLAALLALGAILWAWRREGR